MALLFLLLLCGALADPLDVSPLTGQGEPPMEELQIYVSAILVQLINIDQIDYTFQAKFSFDFHWTDSTAIEAVVNSTREKSETGEECGVPCDNYRKGGLRGLCCDTLYVPTFVLDNVKEYPDTSFFYSFDICDNNTTVEWTVSISAVYYTDMKFQAYPFDVQRLRVRLLYPRHALGSNFVVVPSAGLYKVSEDLADYVSGWFLNTVTLELLDSNVSVVVTNPPSDEDAQCMDAAIARKVQRYYGVDVIVEVKRITRTLILNVVLPIWFIGLLSLVTFMFPPKDLASRLALMASLFIALQAVQFILAFDQPASSYPLPTDSLVITVYAMLLAITLESFVAYQIVRYPSGHQRRAMQKAYYRELFQHMTPNMNVRKLTTAVTLRRSTRRGASHTGAASHSKDDTGEDKVGNGGGSASLHADTLRPPPVTSSTDSLHSIDICDMPTPAVPPPPADTCLCLPNVPPPHEDYTARDVVGGLEEGRVETHDYIPCGMRQHTAAEGVQGEAYEGERDVKEVLQGLGGVLADSWKLACELQCLSAHQAAKALVLTRWARMGGGLEDRSQHLLMWRRKGWVDADDVSNTLTAMWEQRCIEVDNLPHSSVARHQSTMLEAQDVMFHTAPRQASDTEGTGGDNSHVPANDAGEPQDGALAKTWKFWRYAPSWIISRVLFVSFIQAEKLAVDELYAHWAARMVDTFWCIVFAVVYIVVTIVVFVK